MRTIRKGLGISFFCGFWMIAVYSGAWAWDPAGKWKIEGRTDAVMEIKKEGDIYQVSFQSGYSRYRAVGYLHGDKLLLVYTFLSEKAAGFSTLKKIDENRIEQETIGEVKWKGILRRF